MNIQKWKIAESVLRGVDHVEQNKPCQDNVYSFKLNGVTAIALGDGAGSRKHSDIGSKIATKKVCELLTHKFQYYLEISEQQIGDNAKVSFKSLRNDLYKDLYDALSDYASQNNDIKVDSMATTLLFFAFKDDKYIMGHIGDGVIIGLHGGMRKDYLDVLSEPDNGDQPNITFFLTEPDAKENFRLHIGKLGTLKGVLLMSDGPEEVFYNKQTGAHPNTFKVFNNFNLVVEEEYTKVLTNLLEKNVAKYSFDDLSISLLYLETTPLKDMNAEYMTNIFKNIKSKKQLVQRSRNTVSVDDSKTVETNDFSSVEDIKSFLENK